jgi:TolA-binding protein
MNDQRRDPDPIGEFLAGQLRDASPQTESWMKRGFVPAPAKIASIVILVALLAVGTVIGVGVLPGAREQGGRAAPPPSLQAVGTTIEMCPTVFSGEPRIEGGDKVYSTRERLGPGDEVVTGEAGAIGLDFDGDLTIVLQGDGHLVIDRVDGAEVLATLHRGVIAVRLPEDPHGTTLVLRSGTTVIRGHGAVYAAEARGSRMIVAAVSQGEVEVESTRSSGSIRVGAGQKLTVEDWRLEQGAAPPGVLERLAMMRTDVEVPQDAVTSPIDEDASAAGDAPPSPPSLTEQIQAALDAGDLDEALRLVQAKPDGQGGAKFNSLAGEVYRRSSMWKEASAAYLAAAEKGNGKQAEMALIRAAEIQLRKLGDAKAASDIIETYLGRFPTGAMLDEALFLGGVIKTKTGEVDRAIELFAAHLKRYPGSPQSARVHLMLAKLLAVKKSDCAQASAHIQVVLKASSSGSLADDARALASKCGMAVD